MKNKFMMFLMIVTLSGLLSPIVLAEEAPAKTEISISDSPAPVTFQESTDILDQEVFEALCIVVVDQNDNKIDFTREDIKLTYNPQIGRQTVQIDYLGNDDFAPSLTKGSITITEPSRQNSQLILIANPPTVSFSSDAATLDKEVFTALNINLVDEDSNKIDFSEDEISLDYSRNVGNQNVVVTYSGNDKFNGCSASTLVSITPLTKTRVILNLNTPSVDYISNSSALDVAVYQALKVKLVTTDNVAVDFTSDDISISYNREIGIQDVTIKYKGNNLYFPSQATANVKIIGEEPAPTPERTNTSVNLTMPESPLQLNADANKMNNEVYNAINVQVADVSNNNIVFKPEEIEVSFNHEAGDQVVTVRYLGNSTYNASQANVTVTIIDPQETFLVLNAHSVEVAFNNNSQILDDEIIDQLNIRVVDKDNNQIDFKNSDIELSYDHVKGSQKLKVEFLGNDQYLPSSTETEVFIKEEIMLGISTTTMIAIISGVIVVLGIIGFIVYRKRTR